MKKKFIIISFCLLILMGVIIVPIIYSQNNPFLITGDSITGILKEEEESPKQLFDIRFELDEPVVLSSKELIARTIFESFGTESTPVNLTYIITDKEGREMYSGKDSIVVETENVVTKYFEDLDLDYGGYVIFLKTLYNEDVEDEFMKEFEVRRVISKSEKQLFDITMKLFDSSIKYSNDLVAEITFENFGSEPTPVNLSISILDKEKNIVYRESDFKIIETDEVFLKSFDSLLLANGEYTFVLTTVYNVNVEDEFREDFVINSGLSYEWVMWASIVFNLFLILVVLNLLRNKKPAKVIKKRK